MTSRPRVEFDSEHPDSPRWGSPGFAPVQEPTRLTLMLHSKRADPEPLPLDEIFWRTEWYRRRLLGEVSGPLERYRDWYAVLTGDEGGWPSGAVASGVDAECRNAQPDAVIGPAGATAQTAS